MRILIAEDNAEIAHLIQMFLEKEDYEVIWKEDGQAALDYLLCQEVALRIFDIMMPRLDGFTLIQKVRIWGRMIILSSRFLHWNWSAGSTPIFAAII